MCIHSFNEAVSYTIKSTDRFHHCDVLPEIWNDSNLRKKRKSIYLEIGANIGSCCDGNVVKHRCIDCGF